MGVTKVYQICNKCVINVWQGCNRGVTTGQQIRVQHWGMISIFWWLFRYWGHDFKIYCLGEFLDLGMSKLMFFYPFLPNFFDDLFFHFLVKIRQFHKKFCPTCTLPPPPPRYFHCPLHHGAKVLKHAGQKSKLLEGMEAKYWGGCIPPCPRDLQPCVTNVQSWCHKSVIKVLQMWKKGVWNV